MKFHAWLTKKRNHGHRKKSPAKNGPVKTDRMTLPIYRRSFLVTASNHLSYSTISFPTTNFNSMQSTQDAQRLFAVASLIQTMLHCMQGCVHSLDNDDDEEFETSLANLNSAVASMANQVEQITSDRVWYIFPRANKLFGDVSLRENYPDHLFERSFRVCDEVFEEILSSIEGDITKQHTNFRHPISAKERLLIFLFHCAVSGNYTWTGEMFSYGPTTAREIVYEATPLFSFIHYISTDIVLISQLITSGCSGH